jgi:hypothetical protein
MDRSSSLNIVNSFGTGTSRYVGSLPHPSCHDIIDVACGSCIARWNIKEKKRLHLLTDHTSLVTGLIRFGNFLVSVSYGGQVFLRDSDWKILSTANVDSAHVMHVAVDKLGTKVLVNSEVEEKSCFTVFKIEGNQLIYGRSSFQNDNQ